MENNLEILENIMKPYFDKKEQMDNAPQILENNMIESKEKMIDLENHRLETRKELEIELENLRVRKQVALKDFEEKKEQEIEEYISKALDTDSNFFASYGSMLRKDLEQEYDKKLQMINDEFNAKEEKLISEIESLKLVSDSEKEEEQKLINLEKTPNYKNVDLRELVEIKENLRKQLFAEQKRLNFELKQQQINFDSAMLELSAFRYEYNEQQQVINGAAWREIYEKSNLISDKINEIKNALKKLEEYLNLTELTIEEGNAIMRAMTPLEKEEYNRRKALSANLDNSQVEVETTVEVEEKEQPEEKSVTNEDMIVRNDPVVSNYDIEDGNIVVNKKTDLLKTIYCDIMSAAKNIRGIRLNPSEEKLGEQEYYISTKQAIDQGYQEVGTVNLVDDEPMELPNGEYLYTSDFDDALEKYYEKDKGKSYVVRETGKGYTITSRTIDKLKAKLKECSAMKLTKDKNKSKFDITRVFGRVKGEKTFRSNEIGVMYDKANMPEGDYINRNELIASLDNLFTTKKLSWLKKLSDSLKNKKEDQDDFVIEENHPIRK